MIIQFKFSLLIFVLIASLLVGSPSLAESDFFQKNADELSQVGDISAVMKDFERKLDSIESDSRLGSFLSKRDNYIVKTERSGRNFLLNIRPDQEAFRAKAVIGAML